MKNLYVGDNGRPAISQKHAFCRLEMEFFAREKKMATCNFKRNQFLQADFRKFTVRFGSPGPAKIEKLKYYRHHLHY